MLEKIPLKNIKPNPFNNREKSPAPGTFYSRAGSP
jgi:hypothetical protein